MNVLLLSRVDNEILEDLATDTLLFRHDLVRKGPRHLSRFLRQNPVSVIVTADRVDADVLAEWSRAANKPVYVAVYGEAGTDKAWQRQLANSQITVLGPATSVVAAFRDAEQCICNDQFGGGVHTDLREEVTFIGAGIVNLITAHYAIEAGYSVRIIDARPDPRRKTDWRSLGCSAGGGDARMFTLSEMDNYNCRNIHGDMNWQFSRPVTERGWNVAPSSSLKEAERDWIASFESVPGWLAENYNDSIFRFNRESHPLWDEWIAREPELFAASGLQRDILRVYSDATHFQRSKSRQDRIGATLRNASLDEIAAEQPILRRAIEAGEISGGVYVQGFTLNLHRFMANLLDRYEGRGVVFEWNTEMTSMPTRFDGQVDHVVLSTGERVTGNLVISPGVYAGAAIAKTASHRQICGVLGAWLSLPDPQGLLRNSLKLARKNHVTEDANVTIGWGEQGERAAIIGSGYGFTGFNPNNIDEDLLNTIYDGLIDTAATCFPEQYQSLIEAGSLRETLKYCVRPWTPSGLGLFETYKSKACCVVLVGGHNTGGFAQAPAIASAILAAMRNNHHQMHIDYHTDRLSLMTQTDMWMT
ncbi:NAD(P)/FAD-dependent oxidoreductase [Agrobacterium vitis]